MPFTPKCPAVPLSGLQRFGWQKSLRPIVWLLYRNRDQAAARQIYSNRRLIEAAGSLGLAADVFHPQAVSPDMLGPDSPARPLAILSRAGTKLGRRGKTLLGAAETQGIVTVPSRRVLKRAESKLAASELLARNGIPTPETLEVAPGTSTEWIGDRLGFPLVVKNARSSKGEQVRLCRGPEEFATCCAQVAGRGPILAQRYVATSHGRDIRVVVVNGRPVAAMLRRAPDGQLCANIFQGAEAYSTPFTSEAAETAVQAAQVLGLEVAGVDLLFDKSGLTVCEVNISPGLEAIEQVTGRDVAGAIMRHVQSRLVAADGAADSQPKVAVR